MKKQPPFHALFTSPKLAEVNLDYRRRYIPNQPQEQDHLYQILTAAEEDMKARGLTIEAYVEGRPGCTGGAIVDWYANGAKIPRDRKGLVAMLHPQFHKRGWGGIIQTVETMAKELRRWVWVVEAEESRWYLIMVGDAPTDADNCPVWRAHVRVGDQFIAVMSPKGEWRMLGCS